MKKLWTHVYAPIDLKNAVVTISDGTGTPLTMELKLGEGNLTISEKKNIDYILDRGTLDEVREGDEVPLDVRFDATWVYILGSAGVISPRDALLGVGSAAAWVSTDTDGCRPFAVDIIITHTPSPSGCGNVETVTLADFRVEQIDFDLRGATLSFTGRCNVTAPTMAHS